MVKCLGITPNVIEGIFGVMLVMVEGILFFILFDKVWPSHESKKIEKAKNLHTLQVHQVDSVTTVAMTVVAQVMVEEIAEVVEIKLVFRRTTNERMGRKMETVNLIELTKDIKDQHKNFVVSNINSHCLRIAVFTGEYDWHYHSNSDELFIVLEGELLIDFEDGETAVLKPNDSILIPACKIHRTRALKRTVNLCFEHIEADTIKVEQL